MRVRLGEALPGTRPDKQKPSVEVEVIAIEELEADDYERFTSSPKRNWGFLHRYAAQTRSQSDPRKVIEVRGPFESLFVDPAGTNYAKFWGEASPYCAECKRDMAPDEVGDEFPSERVCDECAGVSEPSCTDSRLEPEEDEASEEELEVEAPSRLKLTRAEALEPMSAKALESDRYHPRGAFCAFCEQKRGSAGVCQHCELACGDPCSRCDTGHGDEKHCPCCSPCGGLEAKPLNTAGTTTGRLSSASPGNYSSMPKPALCKRAQDAVDAGLMSLEYAKRMNGLIAAGLYDPLEEETKDWDW